MIDSETREFFSGEFAKVHERLDAHGEMLDGHGEMLARHDERDAALEKILEEVKGLSEQTLEYAQAWAGDVKEIKEHFGIGKVA